MMSFWIDNNNNNNNQQTVQFMENRLVHWFRWFVDGSIAKQFNRVDQIGLIADWQSDPPAWFGF